MPPIATVLVLALAIGGVCGTLGTYALAAAAVTVLLYLLAGLRMTG